jgi:hypothetical protein
MTTTVYGGSLVSYGEAGGVCGVCEGNPEATQGIPRHLSKARFLVLEPPGAAQQTGQLLISRGKFTTAWRRNNSSGALALEQDHLAAPSILGAWRILGREQQHKILANVPKAIPVRT